MRERYSHITKEIINSDELRIILAVILSIWISVWINNNDSSQTDLINATLNGPVSLQSPISPLGINSNY